MSPDKQKESENYFENTVKKFKDYIGHLQKRNELEKKVARYLNFFINYFLLERSKCKVKS